MSGEDDRVRAPRIEAAPYRDPNEGVDWSEEPFHQAFIRNHLYKHEKLPFGFLAILFAGIVAALMWGVHALVQWWTGY